MEKSSSVKPTPEKPRTSYTATSHEAEPLFLPGPSDEEDERGAAQSASKASEKPTATKATREKPRTSGAANSHISEPLFLPGVSDKESDTGTGSAAGAAGRGNVSGLSARKPAKETPIGEKQIEPRHEDSINEEPSSQISIAHAEEPLPGEEEAWYPHALDEFVFPTLPAGDGSSGQDTSHREATPLDALLARVDTAYCPSIGDIANDCKMPSGPFLKPHGWQPR
jgi:hypothetical protein